MGRPLLHLGYKNVSLNEYLSKIDFVKCNIGSELSLNLVYLSVIKVQTG